MRLLTALLGMLLVLLAPATAAADNPFASSIMRQACTRSGDTDGHGYVLLKVGATEFGKSGANYMVFSARVQQFLSNGAGRGQWTTVDRMSWTSDTFPDDSTPWSWWYRAKWSFAHARHPLTRIVMRVGFWDKRPGADVLLAAHSHRGAAC